MFDGTNTLQALWNEMKWNLNANVLYKSDYCVCYLLWERSDYIYPLFSFCRDRNDLAEVVALLKTQIDPELLKKAEEAKADSEEGKDKAEEGKVRVLNYLFTDCY